MHPREAPKQVQSRRKTQPGLAPGKALQQRVGLFMGLTRKAGLPKDVGGGVAPLAKAAALAARYAYPSALGHLGAGALNRLSRSDTAVTRVTRRQSAIA